MTVQNIASPIDFRSDRYKDAYSRINAIAIIGEQYAFENFLRLAQLLPEHRIQLLALAKMESLHKKRFQACGANLEVMADTSFATEFFADLHRNFEDAADVGRVGTCLVIQCLLIECFAIAAYTGYIPVADEFARSITESVVKDEHSHLNFGETWLRANFEQSKPELKAANKQNLPLIWRMLKEVEADIRTLEIRKDAIVEEFIMNYGSALYSIGFSTYEMLQMTTQGLSSAS